MVVAHSARFRMRDWVREATYRPVGRGAVEGSVLQVDVDGCRLAEIHADAHISRRDPDEEADPASRYMLSLQLAGTMSLATDDRHIDLRPGELGVYHSSRRAEVIGRTGHRSLCLIVPEAALGVPRRRVLAAEGVRIPADRGLVPALVPLLRALPGVLPRVPAAQALRALRSVGDMLAAVLQTEADLRTGGPVDPRRDLLDRMLWHIDRHAGDPGLDVARLAAAHFVSVRHVHDLFREVGETPAGRIRSRRIEGACRDLTDPAFDDLPVAAVGVRWGFASPARFTRTFAASTGTTPAAYRRDRRDVGRAADSGG
ncbi:helix-turn-helix domain-containing protein [Pseudonocardia lutea]|uniref:Helix-turn-helix domain-containing protein n=1 Tax=Pseudonocardia lutea TaxID=2172015 RepID=A0ABW1I380_9PSEU